MAHSPTMDYNPLLSSMSASDAWFSDAFVLRPIEGMGAGALASRPIPAGTPLFHIPLAYLLSPWTSALGPALQTAGGQESWEQLEGAGWGRLMLCMMFEESLGDKSKWAGYLATMPREFDAPMWWSEEECKALEGTDIADRIGKDSANALYTDTILPVMRSYPSLFGADPESSPHFSLHSFHVQGSRILSRSFTIPVTRAGGPEPEDGEEEDDVAVMVPMADMLNAAYEMDNARLFADGDDEDEEAAALGEEIKKFGEGYTMITTKDIAAGEQIYNTYASPPNSELLRKYGHVDDLPLPSHVLSALTPEEVGSHPLGNAGDEVEITGDLVVLAAATLSSVSPDSLQPRVEWWLEEGQEDAFSLSFPYPDPEEEDEEGGVPPALSAFARLLTSDEVWARAESKGKLPKPKLDVAAAKVILKAIEARAGKYPQSIAEDLAIVGAEKGRRRDAAVVRLGEKRVLGVVGRLVQAEAEKLAESESNKRKAEDEERQSKRRR